MTGVQTCAFRSDGVKQGIALPEDSRARKRIQTGRALEPRAPLDEEAVVTRPVRIGEVDGLTAFVGGGHATTNDVDRPLGQALNQARELHLDRDGLKAKRRADPLGKEDVIAVGIGPLLALNGNGALGGCGGQGI